MKRLRTGIVEEERISILLNGWEPYNCRIWNENFLLILKPPICEIACPCERERDWPLIDRSVTSALVSSCPRRSIRLKSNRVQSRCSWPNFDCKKEIMRSSSSSSREGQMTKVTYADVENQSWSSSLLQWKFEFNSMKSETMAWTYIYWVQCLWTDLRSSPRRLRRTRNPLSKGSERTNERTKPERERVTTQFQMYWPVANCVSGIWNSN